MWTHIPRDVRAEDAAVPNVLERSGLVIVEPHDVITLLVKLYVLEVIQHCKVFDVHVHTWENASKHCHGHSIYYNTYSGNIQYMAFVLLLIN